MSPATASDELRRAWRRLGRLATLACLLAVPGLYAWLARDHTPHVAALLAVGAAIAVRGLVELAVRRLIPWPSLYGVTDQRERERDSLARRRAWFWARLLRWSPLIALAVWQREPILAYAANPQVWVQVIILPLFFVLNFVILFGPLMLMGVTQMRAYEPGDATWGVKIEDVRGQADAISEVRKVIELWQSGERFVAAGGTRERGVLFIGPPGTGKTMLAKAIATAFNCPLIVMPGSGFAQTFIGMDVVVVRWLSRKARRLAAKWGGQCIVFIDEIDAVAMRRSSLVGGAIQHQIPGGFFGGGMGMLALNQLLVVMDGVTNPPFLRRLLANRVNAILDASFIVPRRLGRLPLRLPPARPLPHQVYWIGATNVPLEALDPALTRAGRLGRHIYFRQPTKRDRLDILDLYVGKVAHEPELDTDEAREELARLTAGYSPAQIEQACSLALTYAVSSGRERFSRQDILDAMVTLEAGTALSWGYEDEEEERATAIHEVGHAVCGHLYVRGMESARLSIRRRGETGGHHQMTEIRERVFHFRDELHDHLVWTLGSYAAELVFYGHTTQGVGGDLQSASWLAGQMVGRWGMAPPDLPPETLRAVERAGRRLLAIAGPGDTPVPTDKRRDEAVHLGYALTIAYQTILANRDAVARLAVELVLRKEIAGATLTRLLDEAGLRRPDVDWADAGTVPKL